MRAKTALTSSAVSIAVPTTLQILANTISPLKFPVRKKMTIPAIPRADTATSHSGLMLFLIRAKRRVPRARKTPKAPKSRLRRPHDESSDTGGGPAVLVGVVTDELVVTEVVAAVDVVTVGEAAVVV